MKRRNGFTLIELLAVIVILAIIAVIATPIIVGIIEDARKSAAADSAYGALDAVEKYYTQSLLKAEAEQQSLPLTINFATDAAKIDMSGTKPTAGTVTLLGDGSFCIGTVATADDGTVTCTAAPLVVNDYNCAYEIKDGKTTDKIVCSK